MAEVRIDERARTLSALLAATDWPEREQQPTPYGVHAQATALRRHVAQLRTHQAAVYLQQAFEQITYEPRPYFGLVLSLSWPHLTTGEILDEYRAALPGLDPVEFADHLRDFAAAAGLAEYWTTQAAAWDTAVRDIRLHIDGVDFRAFLSAFIGDIDYNLVCLPNPLYPTDLALGIRTTRSAYCLVHPRKAVGESPPWPFSADREYLLRFIIHDACQALLVPYLAQHADVIDATAQEAAELPFASKFRDRYPGWRQQLEQLITFAAMALFLDLVDPGAGDSFTLYEQRMSGLRLLPVVVLVLKGFLEQQQAGKYAHVAEYLPQFVADMKTTLHSFGML